MTKNEKRAKNSTLKRDHPFSEELSDDGVRNKNIKKLSPRKKSH